MISVENVGYAEKNNRWLKNISFTVKKNGICLITGSAGSGKTTLLKIMMGFIKDHEGIISWHGNVQKKGELPGKLRRRFRYVPENLLIEPGLSVDEYLGWASDRCPGYVKELEESLIKIFDLDKAAMINDLSHSDNKSMQLIAAFCSKPAVLLLDEPLCFLDAASKKKWCSLFERLGRNSNIIIATEKSGELAKMADKTVSLG